MDYNQLIDAAVENKKSGRCNCAQAVACAFAGAVDSDEQTLSRVTAAFGTGMGTMDGTCGALVGAGIILGIKVGDRIKARALMADIMRSFNSANGATVCRQLKGIDSGVALRHCNDCVRDAATLLAHTLEKM